MTTINEVHEVPRTKLWPLTAALFGLRAGLLCLLVLWLDDWGRQGPGFAAALGRSQRQAISAATAITSPNQGARQGRQCRFRPSHRL